MATWGPLRELCEEVTCPICLDDFRDPVILPECGHNFCRGCLAITWGCDRSEAEPSCPVCKRPTQRTDPPPNRQLANLVRIAGKLRLQGGKATKEAAPERICEKHREPLKLFCQTDESLICTVCGRSRAHKKHGAIVAAVAAHKYKDKIFSCLETLRTEKEKILAYIGGSEADSEEILRRLQSERKKRVADFITLHQLLYEQEKDLLAEMEEAEEEIKRERDEHLGKLSKELSSLKSLIREMEEKCQQPVSEFLQDVSGTLKRYEKKDMFENPEAFVRMLKRRFWDRSYNPFLQSAMKDFQDTLGWAFPKLRAKVTLDPASASSNLVLYEDLESMTWQITTRDQSADPGQHYGFVLGSEGFTVGCHFWEVRVGLADDWAVGLARKPVKDRVIFTPEEGICAVGWWKDKYMAFRGGSGYPLTLSVEPRLIRVCLNCDEGQVVFFDAESAYLIRKFSGISCHKTVYPFFVFDNEGTLFINS